MPEYREKYDEETLEELYSDDELCNAVYALEEEFYETPNDGSMQKTDVEALARKYFSMFNFDGLIENINPDGIDFNGGWMSVQFSDNWGSELYCAAYDEFDESLTPMDWHNF